MAVGKDGKEKVGDEKSLIGRRVSIACIDRLESEWTDVELTGLNQAGAMVAFESRGVFSMVHIPTHIIGSITARYNNAAPTPPEQKTP